MLKRSPLEASGLPGQKAGCAKGREARLEAPHFGTGLRHWAVLLSRRSRVFRREFGTPAGGWTIYWSTRCSLSSWTFDFGGRLYIYIFAWQPKVWLRRHSKLREPKQQLAREKPILRWILSGIPRSDCDPSAILPHNPFSNLYIAVLCRDAGPIQLRFAQPRVL